MLRTFIYKFLASRFISKNNRFKTECSKFNGSFISNISIVSLLLSGETLKLHMPVPAILLRKNKFCRNKIFSFIKTCLINSN